MLALGWSFGATLLLSLQLNTLAFPTKNAQPSKTEHLQRSAYVIEGQPPPACVNEICPLDVSTRRVRAVEPLSAPNSTLNDTIPEISTGNITGNFNGTNALGQHNVSSHEEPDDSTDCSPSDQHPRTRFTIIGANQSIPASCRNGKVRCLFSTNSTEIPHQPYENSTIEHGISNSTRKHRNACRANYTRSYHAVTHQNASFICGDGACGSHNWTKHHRHSSNHSSFNGTVRFPGTNQTAPISCGDADNSSCGSNYSFIDPQNSFNYSINGTSNHSGTRQTAPITCGDGTKPPCSGQGSTPSNSTFNGTGRLPDSSNTSSNAIGGLSGSFSDPSSNATANVPDSFNSSSNATVDFPDSFNSSSNSTGQIPNSSNSTFNSSALSPDSSNSTSNATVELSDSQ